VLKYDILAEKSLWSFMVTTHPPKRAWLCHHSPLDFQSAWLPIKVIGSNDDMPSRYAKLSILTNW